MEIFNGNWCARIQAGDEFRIGRWFYVCLAVAWDSVNGYTLVARHRWAWR